MTRTRPFLVLFALGLLVAAGSATAAAPNGVSTMTPTQALAAAKTAVAQATTVHLAGAVQSGSSSVALNLSLTAGEVGSGTITTGGAGIALVRIGTHVYFKGDKAFMSQLGGTAATLLAGKWFEVSTSTKGFSGFVGLTDMTGLVDSILDNHGTLTVSGPARIGGQPAIGFTDAKTGGTLYIAATGEPYPLELKGPPGQGALHFTAWNGAVRVVPPKNPLTASDLSH